MMHNRNPGAFISMDAFPDDHIVSYITFVYHLLFAVGFFVDTPQVLYVSIVRFFFLFLCFSAVAWVLLLIDRFTTLLSPTRLLLAAFTIP